VQTSAHKIFFVRNHYQMKQNCTQLNCRISAKLRMAVISTTLSLTMILFSVSCFAQIQGSALVAKFGIDGDLYSDYRQNGTFNPVGSHDWFTTPGGSGRGIIDTSGSVTLKNLLSSNHNIAFTKGSLIPRFTVVDTFLLMDAVYGRDYNGNDKTGFTNGSKNGDNPTAWGTTPDGGIVQDKSDIIDAYAGMRRDGTSITSTNPSHIILSMGSTILGTTGNRYVDFELFVNKINYDTITGIFSNSGLAATGGHEDFQFNADGSLKKIGDIDVALSYSSTTVNDISIYIWVNKTTYQNTTGQQKFNFVSGEFYGASNGATYGYAKIVAKAGYTLPLWGSVNSGSIQGPAWGTASKDLGASNNNYYHASNALGQFSETEVDLSSIGIDPAFNNTATNTCSPPYTKIMIKTRSSASFTSALSDFSGPFTFLEIPNVPSAIATAQTLTCSRKSVKLAAASIDNSRNYNWTTSNGNIVGNKDSSIITVNTAGKYNIVTYASPGCPQNTDSVVVGLDSQTPVASVQSIGILNEAFSNTVQLIGGDSVASTFDTPFGGSEGLTYEWSNAKGPLSTEINPVTSDSGWHQLVVTENRNGCKDTSRVYVLWRTVILGPRFMDLSATLTDNHQVAVHWTIKSETGYELYELEKSDNGVTYEKVFSANAKRIAKNISYKYNDNVSMVYAPVIYYRVKMMLPSGVYTYSSQMKVVMNNRVKTNSIISIVKNSSGSLQVNYLIIKGQPVTIRIVDLNGRLISIASQHSTEGSNKCVLNNVSSVYKNQLVLVQLFSDGGTITDKIKISKYHYLEE
jgi:hypothetical protein